MENKINVGNILKSYPKDTELYSPICGKCYLENVNHNYIDVLTPTGEGFSFNYDGTYCVLGEIMLFPSKENKNWSKIAQKICDGDVVVAEDEDTTQMFIVKNCLYTDEAECYIGYEFESDSIYNAGNWAFDRIATEEEKQKLFNAIKLHGYVWNAETKTLEKLPKFKVGDRIKHKESGVYCNIGEYAESFKGYNTNIGLVIRYDDIDNWELYPLPNKFNITTFKLFDKVLMRSSNAREWTATLYSHYNNNKFYGCGMCCDQCIPYEHNEHLRGTTNDCDEYFKTWK